MVVLINVQIANEIEQYMIYKLGLKGQIDIDFLFGGLN